MDSRREGGQERDVYREQHVGKRKGGAVEKTVGWWRRKRNEKVGGHKNSCDEEKKQHE